MSFDVVISFIKEHGYIIALFYFVIFFFLRWKVGQYWSGQTKRQGLFFSTKEMKLVYQEPTLEEIPKLDMPIDREEVQPEGQKWLTALRTYEVFFGVSLFIGVIIYVS